MSTEKRTRRKTRKRKDKVEAPVSTFHQDRHNIPFGIQYLPKVTIYACSLGNKGYRFHTDLTKLNSCLKWSKTMTGREAIQFLKTIKARNRQGKLEAFQLPD